MMPMRVMMVMVPPWVVIGVGVMLSIPVMVVTVMPPRVVRIIIASSEANRGIAAAAGDQDAEIAEE
jgi:hypothetical protein